MTANPTDPMGLDGFEFVEFVSPDPAAMRAHFEKMGFVASTPARTAAWCG